MKHYFRWLIISAGTWWSQVLIGLSTYGVKVSYIYLTYSNPTEVGALCTKTIFIGTKRGVLKRISTDAYV